MIIIGNCIWSAKWRQYRNTIYVVKESGEIRNGLTSKVIKPFWNQKRQYLRVDIDGRSEYVHRIVAEVWYLNPENKPEVNHKNFNRTDNHKSNLEWVTSTENKKWNRNRFKFSSVPRYDPKDCPF